jgi:murein DD-endopeptidase MepM/ murein hydrolase activator NlpD
VPVRRIAAALVSVFLMIGMVPSAGAEVTHEELAEAEAKVRELSRDLEGQLAAVDEVIVRQIVLEDRIAAIESEIDDRERELVLAEFAARERAVAMYVNAGTTRAQTITDVERLTEVGTRDAYLTALVQGEQDVVTRLEFLQEDRSRLEAELSGLVADLEDERALMDQLASDLIAQLDAADQEYRALYDQWWEEEQERRRIAEERRRAEEAAARAAAAAASGYASSAGIPPGGRMCPVAAANTFRDSWGEPRPGGRTHKGTDIVAAHGAPLVAMESGYIWSPNWDYAGGIGLYIRGDSGDIYYYAHLSAYAPGIVDGLRVGVGQVLGYVGETGNAAGPHLHLGYRPGGGPLTNPYQLLVQICR